MKIVGNRIVDWYIYFFMAQLSCNVQEMHAVITLIIGFEIERRTQNILILAIWWRKLDFKMGYCKLKSVYNFVVNTGVSFPDSEMHTWQKKI